MTENIPLSESDIVDSAFYLINVGSWELEAEADSLVFAEPDTNILFVDLPEPADDNLF